MRSLTLPRAIGAGIVLAAIALTVLYLIPSNDYYVFLPDRAHALQPIVSVSGEHPADPRGGVYFVDVRFRKAHLLEDLLGRPLARNGTLVPAGQVTGGASEKQQEHIDSTEMEQSQQTAAAVVLKRLGYHIKITLPRVVIEGILRKAPAAQVLKPGDRLVKVDGQPVHSLGRLRQLLAAHRPGDRLRVTLGRAGRVINAVVRTTRSPDDRHAAAIGILVDETGGKIGKLPLRVRIATAGVGGPSAGLAFALGLMEKLGHNVDRGYKVAATGELELDGSVLPIGAIKQKTIGAREAGVDVFLVPAGANARIARKNADGLRIIPVQSFPQALRALATLAPKHPSSA
jgi:PDZ domain-containing protein